MLKGPIKDHDYYQNNKHLWYIEETAEILTAETVSHALQEAGLLLLRTGKTLSKPQTLTFIEKFGTAVNQSPEGCMIFEVKDEGFDTTHPKFRGPSSNKQLTFHTDRCDVIVFHCARQAIDGGQNLFVHAETLYNTLKAEHPELLDILKQGFPYKRHNADPANPLPYYELPVFGKKNELAITLMNYLIHQANKDPALPNLTSKQKEALRKVQEICERPELQLHLSLIPGDFLFLNNLQMLHSRTAFEQKSQRLYYRTWLSVPWSIELPEAFKVLFGNTNAGALRGGFKKSTE